MPKGYKKVVETTEEEIVETPKTRVCTCGQEINSAPLVAGETVACPCGVKHAW